MTVKATHYNKKKTTSYAGAFHVEQVVTIPEACRIFGKSDGVIRRALDRIPFRQSGNGSYLLSLPALREIFHRRADDAVILCILPRK